MGLMGLLFQQFYHYAKLYVSHTQQHLEYACPIWDPSTVKDHDLVENVQRFASWVSLKMWDSECTEMLNSLNLPQLGNQEESQKFYLRYNMH